MIHKPYYTYTRPDGSEGIGIVIHIWSDGESVRYDVFDIVNSDIVRGVVPSDMTVVGWLDNDALAWVYERYQSLIGPDAACVNDDRVGDGG